MLKRWIVTALLLAAMIVVADTVVAHEGIVSGNYAFVLGWLEEPPIVGLKNAAYVEITTISDNRPVKGAEGSLDARIQFGAQSRELILRPVEGQPGAYAGDFIPTRRGVYSLAIQGQLDGQSIDISGEIEEVGSAASLEFPETQASATDMQQTIDALRGEVSSARAFGVAGLALGTIGLVLAGVSLGRRK